MNFGSFTSDVVATLAGGVGLAILFFLAKERLFPLPEITGRWFFEQRTRTTAYRPYDGMVLRYVAMLWREGNYVRGTVEKIHERSSTGTRDFIGQNRTRGAVSGYVEKRYFGADRVFLHIVEDGHGRESTYCYDLSTSVSKSLDGTFSSMVADQDGTVRWQRRSF